MFPRQFRFLGMLLLALACSAQAAPRFSVTALPAGTNPVAINNAGQIVGDVGTDLGRRGFLWSAGAGYGVFGTLGGSDSSATAINASGMVTGYSSTASGEVNAFVVAGGVMSGLSLMGGATAFATGINDAGQVTGQYYAASGGARGFLYDGAASVDLGDLGGNFAYAAGINNHGHVVGSSALSDEPVAPTEAFLYADGAIASLGSLGGSRAEALAVNDLRQVVGWAWVDGSEHAFFHDGAAMRDLGTLGGRRSFANAINAAGIVVGHSDLIGDESSAAFIYMDGVMTDLNTLIDPAEGWTLYSARDINDYSQIAAWGCRGDECGAVLLEVAAPVPEPGIGTLMLCGLAVLGLGLRGQRSMSMWRIPSSSYGSLIFRKPNAP
jgi:probable HAF family extracellular repeat protein